MRKLKRWWRNLVAEWKLRHRRHAVQKELQTFFNLKKPPRLVLSGAKGHDSNYFVSDGKTVFGVLRLVNPYKSRAHPAPDMPFILPSPDRRLMREWVAYETGSRAGLAPKPLWRAQDAILCAYLPRRPLQERLEENPQKAWDILTVAARRIADMHAAGIPHMDMSLANILSDETMQRLFFVDFEYAPAPGISVAEQKIYDHLRLIEAAYKFIPDDKRADFAPWLVVFKEHLDDDMKRAGLKKLSPALSRVLHDDHIGPAVMGLFAP